MRIQASAKGQTKGAVDHENKQARRSAIPRLESARKLESDSSVKLMLYEESAMSDDEELRPMMRWSSVTALTPAVRHQAAR